MDIQESIDIKYEEIEGLKQLISENHYMNPEQEDELESLIAQAIKFGELCAQRDAKAQAVPEGFVLVPTNNLKYFSNDGENYEIHDTLSGAKHEAKCAIQHYEDMLADQQFDPTCDGNFAQVGYGVVLAESGYSIDHVVTQEDIDKGDYSYEVGTQIMSLHLDEVKIQAQEQSHD